MNKHAKNLLDIANRISSENPLLGYELERAVFAYSQQESAHMLDERNPPLETIKSQLEEIKKKLESGTQLSDIIQFLEGLDDEVQEAGVTLKSASSRVAANPANTDQLFADWEAQYKSITKKPSEDVQEVLAEIDNLIRGLDVIQELTEADIEQITQVAAQKRVSSLIRFASAISNSRQRLLPMIKQLTADLKKSV